VGRAADMGARRGSERVNCLMESVQDLHNQLTEQLIGEQPV
jgi:hypothetical protein